MRNILKKVGIFATLAAGVLIVAGCNEESGKSGTEARAALDKPVQSSTGDNSASTRLSESKNGMNMANGDENASRQSLAKDDTAEMPEADAVDITGSVGRISGNVTESPAAGEEPSSDPNAVTDTGELSEDERFAAELAREAEREEQEDTNR